MEPSNDGVLCIRLVDIFHKKAYNMLYSTNFTVQHKGTQNGDKRRFNWKKIW
jgi:hypothetical protein